MTDLSLEEIRRINVLRSETCFPQCVNWTVSHWVVALLGEFGEAANIYKKVFRGDFTLEEARPELAKELADVQCYLLLTAHYAGIPPFAYAVMPFVINFSLEEQFCRLADKLGQIAYGSYVTQGKAVLGMHCRLAQLNLEMIARTAGIHLRDATISKFNEVSRRIGSDIFLPEVKGIS